MRQINFVIIFIFCLALALFALENTQPGTINIVPEVQVQAPIAIELLLATGIGAVLAWLYSIWTHFLRLVLSGQQVRQKNVQIKELERKVEQYQAEVQSLKPVLPPVNDSVAKEAQVISQ
ncbi:LapA family protein [Brasilonema sp. CT11]|nr:LapA family protein [Brasilonema sp. CT11]